MARLSHVAKQVQNQQPESIRIARVMPSRHRNQPRFTQVVAPEDSAGVEHYSPVDEVGHPFDNPT